jgi:hypothetical protein
MPQHRRTSKGVRLRSTEGEVFIPYITADDLLQRIYRHIDRKLLCFWDESFHELLGLAYELERSKRLKMLRDWYTKDLRAEDQLERRKYFEDRLRTDEADGLDLTFINPKTETRGRPQRPEAAIDFDLLEYIEEIKAETGIKRTAHVIDYLAKNFANPDFLDTFAHQYGVTSRAKQIKALEVRLSKLQSLLRKSSWSAYSETALGWHLGREIAERGELSDMGRGTAEWYLQQRRKKLLS